MSAYERQMIAKYHHADLLREAREVRLAKAARQASGHVPTEHVLTAAISGPVHAALTSAASWLHRRGTTGGVGAAAAQPSVTGHVMLRSAHLR